LGVRGRYVNNDSMRRLWPQNSCGILHCRFLLGVQAAIRSRVQSASGWDCNRWEFQATTRRISRCHTATFIQIKWAITSDSTDSKTYTKNCGGNNQASFWHFGRCSKKSQSPVFGRLPGAERILAAWYVDQPLPIEDQEAQPRNPSGRKGKESSDNIIRLKQGTDTTYTLRRLARRSVTMSSSHYATTGRNWRICWWSIGRSVEKVDHQKRIRKIIPLEWIMNQHANRAIPASTSKSDYSGINPNWSQQKIAEAVGCTKGYVSQVFSKISQREEILNIPPTIEGNSSKADFRKLPPELQQKVAAKEVSLNAAAIQAT